MSDETTTTTTAAPEGESAGGRARRILKDSGRYLLAGVKAALVGSRTPMEQLVAWHESPRPCSTDACDLGLAVKAAMSRRTSTCAERGVDLLLESDSPMLPIVTDSLLLEAAADVTVEVALTVFERGRVVRVVLERDQVGRACAAFGGRAHDDALDGLLTEAEPLWLARAVLAAQGGDLWIERGEEGEATLRLALPARSEAQEAREGRTDSPGA
jgi:hypothetical protein